jgi:hypothetical protein
VIPLPLLPLRLSDLAHTQQAILGYAEQAAAQGRLRADRIQPIAGAAALLIDHTDAVRKWRGPLERTPDHCHLLEMVELDLYGVTALWNRKIADLEEGTYLAFCAWESVPPVATYLRNCLARAIHPQTALGFHTSEAAFYLDLCERSPNDARLPSRSKIHPGTSLRFDSPGAKSFRKYFNLTDPTHRPELATVELGAGCYLIYATVDHPTEPSRAILTNELFLSGARRELIHWMEAVKSPVTKT